MGRKRVYIAGAISRGDLAHNVNQATEAFVALAEAGFAPHCPHWSVYSAGPAESVDGNPLAVKGWGTAAGAPGLSHADWLEIDLAWVRVAAAVLRLPGKSVGADRECEYARAVGIPVFDTVAEVVAWAAGGGA